MPSLPLTEAAGSSRGRGVVLGVVAMFTLLVIVYSFSLDLRATRNSAITGDEPFYLLTTQSLLQDGNFDLRSQYASESYREFFDHPAGLWQQSIPIDNGALLSPHEPGTSFLVLPAFHVWGLPGAQWTMLAVAAAAFALTYLLVALETKAALLSWLVTAAVALAATPFVYATEIYPEVPGAFCLVLSLLILRSGKRDILAAVALMAVLSLLAWFGMKFVFLAVLPAMHFLLQAEWRVRWVFLALGALSGSAYVAFHLIVFDHLVAYSVNTVYEGASSVSVLEQHVSIHDRFYRLWGLFIDRRFGIGRWAPLFLPILPALPLLASKGRAGLTAAGLIVTQLFIAAFLAVTMMGFWFPGRTMMTVIPLFALALTHFALKLPRWTWAGFGVLIALSLAITLGLYRAVHDGPYRLAVDPFDMQAWPFQAMRVLFPDYRSWDAETVLLTSVWLVAMPGLAVALALTRYREVMPRIFIAFQRPELRRDSEATPGRRPLVKVRK